MKYSPILFSGPMVKAILSGAKTQTRRVLKLGTDRMGDEFMTERRDGTLIESVKLCPYGQPGDRLWVRETWRQASDEPKIYPGSTIYYRADEDWNNHSNWKPSIFMPRWASRITLEIVNVSVERVQEISPADVEAEGCAWQQWAAHEDWLPTAGYAELWDSINAKRGFGWDKNPWVWVLEFKRII
jgi:hypothetical protein